MLLVYLFHLFYRFNIIFNSDSLESRAILDLSTRLVSKEHVSEAWLFIVHIFHMVVGVTRKSYRYRTWHSVNDDRLAARYLVLLPVLSLPALLLKKYSTVRR
jgi:hypothetical protein